MKTFWESLPQPFFILAPMEAVTDIVFRHVIEKSARPDVYFTEFTNATGWEHAGEKAIGGRLIKSEKEFPLVAQLWGSDPVAMEKLSIQCREWGFHGIDINMGCPDASATKGGGGAQMIRTPDVAAEMIAAAKKSGLPVSVKTRLGYSSIDERHEWLAFLLQQNIAALTVHLRSKQEMSKVAAHWEVMNEIKQLRDNYAPSTLVVGNGDVRDRQHGMELVAKTGIDGIMIGRGIFHNPFAFETEQGTHDKSELINLLRYQLNMYDRYSPRTRRPFDTLKRFFKIYIRDFEGASELRDKLMHAKSSDQVRALISADINKGEE